MNKNNYYYRKLAQTFLYSDGSWRDIIDPKDPHDNIFTVDFILQLEDLLVEYYQKSCLADYQKEVLYSLLNDIRFCYPYKNQTEKRFVYNKVNEMLDLIYEASDDNIEIFYKSEYEKRYGRYLKFGCLKEFSYVLFSELLKEGFYGIEINISQDIYPLTLLYHSLEEMPDEHKNAFLTSECFLSTLSAIEVECPEVLQDNEIRNRFLTILRQNQYYFKNPQIVVGDGDYDIRTRIQNKILLRRLENLNKKL